MQDVGRCLRGDDPAVERPISCNRLMHLLTEEYPGLALMLQSRPKDVAALGTRLVCISNLPEDESEVRAPSIVGHLAIWFRAGPWYRNGKVNAFECHAGTD